MKKVAAAGSVKQSRDRILKGMIELEEIAFQFKEKSKAERSRKEAKLWLDMHDDMLNSIINLRAYVMLVEVERLTPGTSISAKKLMEKCGFRPF